MSACAPYSRVLCPACSSAIRVRTEFLHFSLEKQIGEGGMSRVFLARDKTLGRQVALKILNQDYSQDATRAEQFEREGRITAAISHPNVVKVFSVGHDQGHFFIAMELVGGGSLDEVIAKTRGVDEARVLEIGAQLVKGLRAAFEQGLIHRDMKPGNVLFSDENAVKIVDFGLALMFEKDVDESNEIWATPYYVPPEKLHKEPDDFRGDIYSLGATLFHALAGKPPYAADTSSLEELKAIKDKPVHLKDAAPMVSEDTCALIDQMMARQPGERHPSYDALLEHVEYTRKCLADGGATSARRESMVALASARPKPWLIPAVGAALLGVVIWIVAALSGGSGGGNGAGDGKTRPELTEDTGFSFDGGGTTTAQKFVNARSAMVKGNLDAAAKTFAEIASDSTTKQPTLNWARFNLGLCALMRNDGKSAAAQFGRLREDARFSAEEKDQSLCAFFRKVGDDLSGSLPVLAERTGQYDGAGIESLGLLACALKNWQIGQAREAVAFFDVFSKAEPSGEGAWASEYKALPSDYAHDAKLLATVPDIERDASLAEYAAVVGETRRIHDALKLDGLAKKALAKRLDRLGVTLARLERADRESEVLRMAELREREMKDFAILRMSLQDFRGAYRFGEAVAALGKQTFEHPEVRELYEDELYVWRTAEEFLTTLTEDLNRFEYTGDIKRRDGSVMKNATIFRATRNDLNFRLGTAAAESKIPVTSVSEAGLLEIAQVLSPNFDESREYLKRREYLVIFAYVTGETDVALSAGEELRADSKDFRTRWDRIVDPHDD